MLCCFDEVIKITDTPFFFTFQIFSANVANKEGEMEISVGFGRTLLHSDRITNDKSKQDVNNDIEKYSSRKNQINQRIKARKSE